MKMPTIAQDSGKVPKLLQVNSNGFLENSGEHSLKGKTILYDNNNAANAVTVIRTVTAGKTYYLMACGLKMHSTTDNKWGQLQVGAGADVLLYGGTAITAGTVDSFDQVQILSFPHPLPIAAGVEIKVQSNDATTLAAAWIIGWEE